MQFQAEQIAYEITEQSDGKWHVGWPPVAEVSAVAATEEEAVEAFMAELNAAVAADPVIAAKAKLALLSKATGLSLSPAKFPPEFQELPSVEASGFDAAVNSSVPTLVDFWGITCAPCAAVVPALVAFQNEYAERVRVVKVNADGEPDLCERLAIQGVPALLLFRDGELLARANGALSLEALREKFAEYLG